MRPKWAGGPANRPDGPLQSLRRRVWAARVFALSVPDAFEKHFFNGLLGLELILPDWFYAGVMDAALVLTIDPAYFRLTGGIERWLYRLVRKHGGRQPGGWQFDFRHLYRKSGSATRFSDFAYDLRALVARQSLPGYVLGIERMPDNSAELLTFRPVPFAARG